MIPIHEEGEGLTPKSYKKLRDMKGYMSKDEKMIADIENGKL